MKKPQNSPIFSPLFNFLIWLCPLDQDNDKNEEALILYCNESNSYFPFTIHIYITIWCGINQALESKTYFYSQQIKKNSSHTTMSMSAIQSQYTH